MVLSSGVFQVEEAEEYPSLAISFSDNFLMINLSMARKVTLELFALHSSKQRRINSSLTPWLTHSLIFSNSRGAKVRPKELSNLE